MKKFAIVVFFLLLFSGCEPKSQKSVETEDGSRLYARKFTFEEHQYIEFYRNGHFSYDNYTGFVHDPNCWCMVDYD